jgi:NifU-like protein involved in Fe-S cluster formation
MYTEKVMEHFKNPKNVGEIKDYSGIGKVGNPVCLTGNTLIISNQNTKKIRELEKGNIVLSHKGGFHKVVRKFVREYDSKTYFLDVWNLGKIQLTPEHNILAARISRSRDKFRHRLEGFPDWFAAKELKKGDYLLYPIPCGSYDKKFIKFDVPIPKYDFKSKDLPIRIMVDKHFLKLVGFYLSEGYVRTDKCKGTLGFSFGSHEEHYVQETARLMKKVVGLDCSKIYRARNSINIVYYSARLARFFSENFGKGAKAKRLPYWAILLPVDKQKMILSGLWQGDGYVNGKTGKFVTISEQLAYQTSLLLLRQRILFSFLNSPEKGMHKKHYSIYIKERESLKKIAELVKKKVSFPKLKFAKHRSWYSGNYLYIPIRNISVRAFSGPVYNLEVEGDHSYVTSCAAVHNCGDIMQVYVKIKGEKIVDAKFKTFGCCAAIASSDAVCELVKGKTLDEALTLTKDDIVKYLGDLPPVKVHCSLLGVDALKKAVKDYKDKHTEKIAQKKKK